MSNTQADNNFEGKSLSQVIQEAERKYICWAINETDGNKAEAARIAGMTYQTFTRKLGALDLRVTYHAA